MTELLISSRSSSCENFWYPKDGFQSLKPRYNFEENKSSSEYPELVHSKSDDLILQNAPLMEPEIHHGISDAAIQIQKDACVVYDDDIAPSRNSKLLSLYYSDSEMNNHSSEKCDTEPEIPVLKLTGCFDDSECSSRRTSKYIDVSDKVDPECSIRDIISKNDFYKFVLFKKHYEKYLDISKKYEEARNISYFLEEKYHEVKNQRDSLIESNKEWEKKLELKDLQLLEKDEELFKQLEKILSLEEDCEKLRQEKEKIQELKEQLQKDKNEMYKQLRFQADDSEVKRHNFEKTRNDLMKQMSEIVTEKNHLEKENTELKEVVGDLERKIPYDESVTIGKKRNLIKLQQQMTDLKVKAKQSATLNSQLKKGMKHLATCRRRKCSVCAYTRATFGDYSSNRRRNKPTGCFPFQEHRKREPSGLFDLDCLEDSCAELAKRLSECSFSSMQSYLPAANRPSHIPYIDECSTPNESEDENEMCKNSTAASSLAGHAFYSDSGFSSELCDSSFSHSKSNSIRRSTKWTKSFRKLIRRVSSKKPTED